MSLIIKKKDIELLNYVIFSICEAEKETVKLDQLTFFLCQALKQKQPRILYEINKLILNNTNITEWQLETMVKNNNYYGKLMYN